MKYSIYYVFVFLNDSSYTIEKHISIFLSGCKCLSPIWMEIVVDKKKMSWVWDMGLGLQTHGLIILGLEKDRKDSGLSKSETYSSRCSSLRF